MARINFYRNAFEDKYEEQEYDFSKSLIKNIEQWSNEIDDIEELVECYDVATGETFFAPLDDSDEKSVLIIVNGQSVSDTYKVQECDVINVIFLPLSSRYFNAGSMIGAGIGMFLMGMLVAFAPYSAPLIASGVSGWLATTAGTMTALLGGAAIGYLAGTSIYNKMHQTFSSSNGKDSSSMPDVRGGSNESLVNNPYPFVIGKHLVNPRICAFPYTEYTGERGENAYIRIVYCIGYAPLKLTDFKLGDFILAYNRTQGVARETVINGVLKGYSTQEVDDGDILDYWKNNDIELEILQHKPNSPVNYGHIFPDKITEQEINAPVLFVNDDTIAEAATVTYKGVLFPKRFRTNGVFFTESCPMEFTINLDAPNGLYATRSKTSSNNTTTEYESIPLWYCIQWRPYDKGTNSSDSEGGDYNSWNNITNWNGVEGQFMDTYTVAKHQQDVNAHTGNTISYNISSTVEKGEKLVTVNELITAVQFALEKNIEQGRPYTYLTGINVTETEGRSSTRTTAYIQVGNSKHYILNSGKPVDSIIRGQLYNDEGYASQAVYYNKTLYIDCYLNNPKATIENGGVDGLITEDRDDWFTINCPSTVITLYNSYLGASTQTIGTSTVSVTSIKVARDFFIGAITSTLSSDTGFYIDKQLVNFQSLSGEDGVSQTRIRGKVTLTKDQCKQMISENNSIKGIEVRVIRVSANYLNQSSTSSQTYGTYSYSDNITVSTIVTKVFNEQRLRNDDVLEPVKIQSEADMNRFVYVALKAKADNTGNITSSLENFSCTAEAFQPTWNKANKKWLPENVHRVDRFYGYFSDFEETELNLLDGVPQDENVYFISVDDEYVYVNQETESEDAVLYKGIFSDRLVSASEYEINKSDYEKGRRAGFSWYREKTGSNFGDLINAEVFAGETVTKNGYDCNYLPEDAKKFNDNSSASGFMLCAVGQQNGTVGLGYENIDTLTAGEWYEDCEEVQDGSKDENNNLISIRMEANGYVTQQQKLETLLSNIAVTGRAVYTYDEKGRIQPVMDKPCDYPVGVINSQNCISESNSFDYSDLPAGLRIAFPDENDGYQNNSFYCWADGNSIEKYRGQVESYSFNYITNPRQAWSLGRYVLATRLQTKENLTVKIGREGRLFPLGSMVLVQSDELLIGGGSGRIQETIEDENGIYGIITDSTFNYTDDEETISGVAKSVQGISILQPKEYGNSRVITVRLAKVGTTVYMNGEAYTAVKGVTNVLLFDIPLTRYSGNDHSVTSSTKITFKTGDIAMFGTMEKISARYKVAKIKPEGDGKYTETLYPYDESIYNYGTTLPSFQNYVAQPSPLPPQFSLSETPTNLSEESESKAETINLAVSNASSVYTCELTRSSPTGSSANTQLSITVYKDGVQVTDDIYCKYQYEYFGSWTTESGVTKAVYPWSTLIQETIQNGTKDIIINKPIAIIRAYKVMLYSDSNCTDLLATSFLAGNNATSYYLITDVTSIKVNSTGVFTPSTITLTGKQTESENTANYAGRFVISTSTNNGTLYTEQYTSQTDEATKTFTIPANTTNVKCQFYLSGDTTTLLDEDVIPVVYDGTDGEQGFTGGTDGYQEYQFAWNTSEQTPPPDSDVWQGDMPNPPVEGTWYDAPPTWISPQVQPTDAIIWCRTKFIEGSESNYALRYQGTWDALNNVPQLSDATGTAGHFYRVINSATRNLGSGAVAWVEGKQITHNGISWEQSGFDTEGLLGYTPANNNLVPNEASASNQLSDKNFVNSSIATNTANFLGTNTTATTEADFLTWANALQNKTNNDYVFWQTTDTNGNTVYKRYKYNGSSWVFEYNLNNSSFTASQWATINSGLGSADKTKIDAIPTFPLSVANGGTGQTTLNASANALINSLSTGTSDPQDDDYYVSQFAGGTQATYHRRPVSKLWNYIKGKIQSVAHPRANYNTTIKTGSTSQSKISLQTLMDWLITTQKYIPSGVRCSVTIQTTWSYADNDILQLSINGTNYELQLAGVIIEFMGNATDYQTGMFRLRIHSSPTTSFTATSGYTKFPVSHIAEYTCNGSSYSPTWRMLIVTSDTATTTDNGLMSASDKTKLNGIATGANNYVHPTTAGNKHIPSGGSSGQYLKWSASGTATWASVTANASTLQTKDVLSDFDDLDDLQEDNLNFYYQGISGAPPSHPGSGNSLGLISMRLGATDGDYGVRQGQIALWEQAGDAEFAYRVNYDSTGMRDWTNWVRPLTSTALNSNNYVSRTISKVLTSLTTTNLSARYNPNTRILQFRGYFTDTSTALNGAVQNVFNITLPSNMSVTAKYAISIASNTAVNNDSMYAYVETTASSSTLKVYVRSSVTNSSRQYILGNVCLI